jgi:DNA-binding MarR family transcriptional regulator
MTERPSKIVVRTWARLMRAQQLTLASIELALKAAGLPPLDWYDVLLEVERAGDNGVRPFELEKAVLLAQYNLSRLVDRIERAGYVERRACEEDGRGQLITITAAGKAMRRKVWPIYAQAIEVTIGQHLSGNDAETLDAMLGKLIEKNMTG